MIWTLPLIAYFACAAALWAAGVRSRAVTGVLSLLPFGIHGALVIGAAVRPGTTEFVPIDWVPSLGLSLTLRLDPVTFILWGVIAAVGALVTIYSLAYFADPGRQVRFLALILVFTGGMVGLVAVDELLGIFIFWEVTTVASYLLIGFDDESATARSAALQAVLVTSAGGLAMLGGIVLLQATQGTTSIAALTTSPPGGGTATAALVLLLAGAFTKSAQAPFHFWLPGAMSAPTPASAYLHSATMVKAGIVLMLLIEPIFGTHAAWTPLVASVGLVTMVLGAVAALRQNDLKLLLAHGTVSQLGLMTALIGLRQTGAALALLVAHAIFKAALFLIVGVIDKATGTRDISRLGGLRFHMPGVAAVAGLAAASMAGLPPLLGFIAKEGVYDAVIGKGQWVPLAVIGAVSVMTIIYSARLWFGAFGGIDTTTEPPTNRPWLVVAPAVLAVTSLILGFLPGGVAGAVAATGASKVKLVLWPGLTGALAMSVATFALGGLAAWLSRNHSTSVTRAGLATRAYAASLKGLNRVADRTTGILQNGSLPVYLAVILTTVVGVPALIAYRGGIDIPSLPIARSPVEAGLALGIIVAAITATRVDRRMAAALLLGVVGYGMAGLFVAYGAPDLALTQLLVETLTVALFAFVLARLPRQFGAGPASLSARTRVIVAGLVGAGVTLATVVVAGFDVERSASAAYVDAAEQGGGRNVVNVILTNFRALDTLGEIAVLAIAAAGVGALVGAGRRSTSKTEVPS